ncbi:MAG: HAD family phosphatase, partial [Atopobiaceae bacterium]|nr:HAD family phosphatase [Atopobiaceae bacterium]
MIKLVLADMDGTLLPFGADRVSNRTQAAIRALGETGITFGLATGRDMPQLRTFFDDGTAFGTGIMANGMKVYVDGDLSYLMLLENESLQRIADLLDDEPDAFLNLYPHGEEGRQRILSVGCTKEDIERFSARFPLESTIVACVPDIPLISATTAFLGDAGEFPALIQRVKGLVPCFDCVLPFAGWCDILPAGVNKGTALPQLIEAAGVIPDEVLFFGDGDNDLPLYGALENTVAVANAMPAAAAAARWHVGS